MVSNFVIIDLTSDNADALFYDEWAQSKDVDVLCSLWFTYHSNKFKTMFKRMQVTPKILVVILDNCVVATCHAIFRLALHHVLH